MKRLYSTIVLLAVAPLAASAQRLDGCPEDFGRPGVHFVDHPTDAETDQRLKESGYMLTNDSLLSALHDLRPDVRSLAAGKLSTGGQAGALSAITQAWSAEKDQCTKTKMDDALSKIGSRLVFNSTQHPGGQQRVTPFQPCTPSEPQVLSFNIEQLKDSHNHVPDDIRITLRNLTPQTVGFFRTFWPEQEISAVIIGPFGAHTAIKKEQEWLYHPLAPASSVVDGRTLPYFFALPPQEDVTWLWWVGQDFDMSMPGTYRVSLGGRIDYLNTTVCSNTIDVTVGN